LGSFCSALFALALAAPQSGAFQAENPKESLAPGLHHITIRRGTATTTTRYRVLVGMFESQSQADRLLEQLEKENLPASPHYRGGRYYISINGLVDRKTADSYVSRLVAAGFKDNLAVQEYQQDVTNPDGPWEIHVLEVDPRLIRVEVASAYDAVVGLEATSDLAERHGAVAAVNGGYFIERGIYRGDPRGVMQIDGALLSEPDRSRAAVGFYEEEGSTRSLFGRLVLESTITLSDGGTLPLDGLNRRRGSKECILFTPEFHRTTLTRRDGLEVVVRGNESVSVGENVGSSVIPFDGWVLSLGRIPAQKHISRFRVGEKIKLETSLKPLSDVSTNQWHKARFVLGGGPLLLLDGKRVEDPKAESIARVFFLSRHPRTAVGMRQDGTLLFVTVDGRQPERSVGLSLVELTEVLLELKAVSAINLDGGGSTTMVIRNKPVNSMSDPTGERETANAILLFPRGRFVHH
jgi:exopolysaccharide biosynthesis protein